VSGRELLRCLLQEHLDVRTAQVKLTRYGRRADGLTRAEKEELTRLRKENQQLRRERQILRKAAVFFASIP
jgi:transposase-like protein